MAEQSVTGKVMMGMGRPSGGSIEIVNYKGEYQRVEADTMQLCKLLALSVVIASDFIEFPQTVKLPHMRSDISAEAREIEVDFDDLVALFHVVGILVTAHQQQPGVWDQFIGAVAKAANGKITKSSMIPAVVERA